MLLKKNKKKFLYRENMFVYFKIKNILINLNFYFLLFRIKYNHYFSIEMQSCLYVKSYTTTVTHAYSYKKRPISSLIHK